MRLDSFHARYFNILLFESQRVVLMIYLLPDPTCY